MEIWPLTRWCASSRTQRRRWSHSLDSETEDQSVHNLITHTNSAEISHSRESNHHPFSVTCSVCVCSSDTGSHRVQTLSLWHEHLENGSRPTDPSHSRDRLMNCCWLICGGGTCSELSTGRTCRHRECLTLCSLHRSRGDTAYIITLHRGSAHKVTDETSWVVLPGVGQVVQGDRNVCIDQDIDLRSTRLWFRQPRIKPANKSAQGIQLLQPNEASWVM